MVISSDTQLPTLLLLLKVFSRANATFALSIMPKQQPFNLGLILEEREEVAGRQI